jgi:hypothetical protein
LGCGVEEEVNDVDFRLPIFDLRFVIWNRSDDEEAIKIKSLSFPNASIGNPGLGSIFAQSRRNSRSGSPLKACGDDNPSFGSMVEMASIHYLTIHYLTN